MATTDVVRQTRDQIVASPAQGSGQTSVFDLITRQHDQIAMALPKHLDTERFTRIALTTIRTNPKLAQCDALSLIGALMVSAQLGLEPGGPLGQAYLVPRWNSKTGSHEAQFQLGYKGIIELARRSGQLQSIEAHEVCENDEFSYSYGLDDDLTHKPTLRGERGRTYAYYAIAKFKDGGHAFVVLSRADIDQHRARSASKDSGPWVTDYDAMARKTCIRALAPYLPLSPELERAMRGDERVFRAVEPDMVDVPALQTADEDQPEQTAAPARKAASPRKKAAPAAPEPPAQSDLDPKDDEPAEPDEITPPTPPAAASDEEPKEEPANYDTVGDEDGWAADQWRGYLRARGVRAPDLLKEANRLCRESADLGEPPASLDDLAGRRSLCAMLRGWVEDQADAGSDTQDALL